MPAQQDVAMVLGFFMPHSCGGICFLSIAVSANQLCFSKRVVLFISIFLVLYEVSCVGLPVGGGELQDVCAGRYVGDVDGQRLLCPRSDIPAVDVASRQVEYLALFV